jgi:uncharacterized membrane protein YfcA
MPELTDLHYVLFFVAGLVAGTVDAIAGGGGLIVLPTLLGVGVPAPLALGTNKLGSVFGSGSATWIYVRRGAVGPGLALGAGQLLGGRLGAHMAMTRGARFVRPIFLVMAGLTVLKLLYQHYLPS